MTRTGLPCAVLFFAAATAFAQVPAGPEFPVSDPAVAPSAFFGDVASDASGNFVVTWAASGIPAVVQTAGRRFNAAGAPLGPEFVINNPGYRASQPRVASTATGRVTLVWTSLDGRDGSGAGIFARRYDEAGVPLGVPFQVNSFVTGDQQSADVAIDGNGNFVVVWESAGQDGDGQGVFGQRHDALGNRLGAEFRVSTHTPLDQGNCTVAADPTGNFIVTWDSVGQDGDSHGVFAQRYDAAGAPAGGEFQVNGHTPLSQGFPVVSTDPAGSFVIVWTGNRAAGIGINGQRFSSSGTRVGSEFAVSGTSFPMGAPVIASNGGNGFVVAWTSIPGDGDGPGVVGQRFDALGVRRGAEFSVNTWTTSEQTFPSAAMDAAGNFVVAWTSKGQGSNYGQFGQRFANAPVAPISVDPGGNGVFEPGEAVAVVTSWRNMSGGPQTLTGSAAAFNGPGAPNDPVYTIVDGTADYGTVPNGALVSCAATGNCFSFGISTPTTRPVVHWDATFREDIMPAPQGPAPIRSIHIGDSFTDVPRSSSFYRFIETMLHHNLSGGCGGGNFCPSSSTAREQMAVFVLVAREGPGYQPAACVAGSETFADVPASSPFCRWIEELARRSVAGGCGGGNFCPAFPVTREQMAVFALATKEGPGYSPIACVPGNEVFADVPASSPFCRWVEELARRSIAGGCGGGNFCPVQAVTREQNSVFIGGTFGLSLY